MSTPSDLPTQLPENIPFCKFSASANDFIVIDNRNEALSNLASKLAERVCARRYSVGADGMILIENSDQATFRVRYFNPDGEEFSTCGNGGRCAARFAFLSGIATAEMTMETNSGVIDAAIQQDQVKLRFLGPSKFRLNVPVPLEKKEIKGHFIKLGDPHFIVYTKDLRKYSIVPLARQIRYHQTFGEQGTNVHFIEILSRQNLMIRSYERGVEDETLACGSGCISASIATFLSKQTDPPITFEPQSRIPLVVYFEPQNNFESLYLEGDARLVYRGELSKEAISGF